MASHNEGPWFSKGKNTWYITESGRNVSLGVRGKGNRKEDNEEWKCRLRDEPKDKSPAKLPGKVSDAVTDFW